MSDGDSSSSPLVLRPIDLAPHAPRGVGEDPICVAAGPHAGHLVEQIDEVDEYRHLLKATCSCGGSLEITVAIAEDLEEIKHRNASLEDDLSNADERNAECEEELEAANKRAHEFELERDAFEMERDALKLRVERLEKQVARLEKTATEKEPI